MLFKLGSRKIHFDLAGPRDGDLVCLVHSLATDSGMWAEQLPSLFAAGYRVLRVDLRGHGGSDAIDGDYSMYDLADDVAATLRYVGAEKVHLVGLSIGGMVGQAFVDKHSSLLHSLVLCDTEPMTPAGAASLWQPRIATVMEAGSLAPIANGMVDRWLTPAFRARNPIRSAIVLDTIISTNIVGWKGCAAAIQNFDFTSTLPKVKVRSMVVCGADDPATPPAANKRIAELIPGARFSEIAGAKHLPNIEKAAEFNKVLIDWLGSVSD